MPKSMSVVKQAIVADVGDEADGAMAESAAAGQAGSGRKVLPIVESVVLVAALVAPLVLQDYLTVFATRVIILALFALSFDLVWGYAGIMSFGQALFFGSAGYGVALLARDFDITNIFLVLPAGTIIGLTFALLLGGFLLLGRHPSSVIFVSLGTVAGLAGSLYAFHEGFVWPNMVGVVVSTQVVLYVLFGGSGTLIGAVIGAVIVEGVSFWLSDNYREIWPIILGLLLLLVILFRPLGLISFVLGERERVGSFGAKAKENVKEKRNAAP